MPVSLTLSSLKAGTLRYPAVPPVPETEPRRAGGAQEVLNN